jgi:ribonuclease BN (tRNA processing enzyme)
VLNQLLFVPLGIGDAFSEKYYSSSLFVQYQNFAIAVDCPHPFRKILKEAAVQSKMDISLQRINAVVLTHLHADHSSGLEGVGFYSKYVEHSKMTLAAHSDVMQSIWPEHLQGTMAPLCEQPERQRRFEDFFTPVKMDVNHPVSIGPFLISCRLTRHHVPTTALKIEAGGKILGYSADTAFDPELIEWLSGADIIIHETNTGSHTPYEQLNALPDQLKEKMRLIHYPDTFDKKKSTIEPLDQGCIYRL